MRPSRSDLRRRRELGCRHRGAPRPSTLRRVRALCQGPGDSREENSADFLYSIHYASVTSTYTLKGGTVHLTWLPFIGATQMGLSLPKQARSRRLWSVASFRELFNCTVALTFLSKPPNKGALLMKAMRGWREVVEGLQRHEARPGKRGGLLMMTLSLSYQKGPHTWPALRQIPF